MSKLSGTRNKRCRIARELVLAICYFLAIQIDKIGELFGKLHEKRRSCPL